MIIAERTSAEGLNRQEYFGKRCRTEDLRSHPAEKIYRLREAILMSKKLGRPLTDREMKEYEI